MAVNQVKGDVSFVFSGISIENLAEDSISYDIGELGDTLSALDVIVHLRKNPNSVITTITANVVKGAENLNELLVAFTTGTPAPITIKDGDRTFVMKSANPTQITSSNTTGGNDIETYSFIFKGKLDILSL